MRVGGTAEVMRYLGEDEGIKYPDTLFNPTDEVEVSVEEIIRTVDEIVRRLREKIGIATLPQLDEDHAAVCGRVIEDEARRSEGAIDRDLLAAEFVAQLMLLETLKRKYGLVETDNFNMNSANASCFALTSGGSIVAIGIRQRDGRAMSYSRMKSRNFESGSGIGRPRVVERAYTGFFADGEGIVEVKKDWQVILPRPIDIVTSPVLRIYEIPANLPPRTRRAMSRVTSQALTGTSLPEEPDLEPIIPPIDELERVSFNGSLDFELSKNRGALWQRLVDYIGRVRK
ncbi:hypothetical protein HY605_01575 [Candidatus Peregrinibacteria bacterium]|nr:hypothetical protein [Candidatus Peregrinibacteria bacterium]